MLKIFLAFGEKARVPTHLLFFDIDEVLITDKDEEHSYSSGLLKRVQQPPKLFQS